MNRLITKAFGGLLFLLLVMGALLFLPAWTLDYWQARVFLGVFFGSSFAITIYLSLRSGSRRRDSITDFSRRRVVAREEEREASCLRST